MSRSPNQTPLHYDECGVLEMTRSEHAQMWTIMKGLMPVIEGVQVARMLGVQPDELLFQRWPWTIKVVEEVKTRLTAPNGETNEKFKY